MHVRPLGLIALAALLFLVGCSEDKDPVQSFKDDILAKLNDPKIVEQEDLGWLKRYLDTWEVDVVKNDSLVILYRATASSSDTTIYFKFEDDQWSATGFTVDGAVGDIGPNKITPTIVAINKFLGVE